MFTHYFCERHAEIAKKKLAARADRHQDHYVWGDLPADLVLCESWQEGTGEIVKTGFCKEFAVCLARSPSRANPLYYWIEPTCPANDDLIEIGMVLVFAKAEDELRVILQVGADEELGANYDVQAAIEDLVVRTMLAEGVADLRPTWPISEENTYLLAEIVERIEQHIKDRNM